MTHEAQFQTYPPTLVQGAANPEAVKYGRMWERPEYRVHAPGETWGLKFLEVAKPRPGAEVLDLGCGTGRGGLLVAMLGGVRVVLVDFVRNCLDPEVRDCLTTQAHALRFVKADLEQPLGLHAPYGYCTDVLEHIPPDKVGAVLVNVLKAAQHVFFSIATEPDQCGALIGETLHLTVQPAAWWRAAFAKLDALILWEQEEPGTYLCYVTAWQTGRQIVEAGLPNTESDAVRDNVRTNIAGGWKEVTPHEQNTLEVAILGGGPSLPSQLETIRRLKADGVKVVTLNGAYGWALAQELGPVTQVMVDARAFNRRFVEPVRADCMYLMASQVHPSVLAGLPRERTWLWHASPSLIGDLLDARGQPWCFIPGGSTVLLRAIPLLRMLGYTRFHLFGCDSCLMEQVAMAPMDDIVHVTDSVRGWVPLLHHAYTQPENNDATVVPVLLEDGSRFWCHVWMISQAQEFQDLIRAMGDVLELAVYGDGLLAAILNGAALAATATTVNLP